MPNMIDAGGLTIKQSTKQLPATLAEFVNGAEHGVILVTFGSMASSFPREITEKFLSAFQVLVDHYRVIWRFNNTLDKMNIPKNVFVSNWLPQNDLLAHPNVLLFITHGGNNGQMESIYHAKPMIGFPLNGDQPYNVRRMAYKGYGLEMDIHEFTSEMLVCNIHEVIQNPVYKAHVSLASEIFKSDAQRPAEKAVWWIEHVIKFGGDYLRSAGNDLPWYQYWLLDVLSFILVLITCMLVFLLTVCRFLYRRCFSKQTDRLENEKKKN